MNIHVIIRTACVVAIVIVGAVAILDVRADRRAHERTVVKAVDAEARIKRTCDQAAVNALMTLRALKTSPEIGLTLALRDASMTQLCGGDYSTIEAAVLAEDVEATFQAVLAQRDAWCPTCAERRRERLQEEPKP